MLLECGERGGSTYGPRMRRKGEDEVVPQGMQGGGLTAGKKVKEGVEVDLQLGQIDKLREAR